MEDPKIYYRVIKLNEIDDSGADEDFWLCEDCYSQNFDDSQGRYEGFMVIEIKKDDTGDYTCEDCGIYFDHEEGFYTF